MITKFLSKLKSILFKSEPPSVIPEVKTSTKKTKSAEAFYKAGFKTPKSIASAKKEDLLAIPGVGISLVKKLKNLK